MSRNSFAEINEEKLTTHCRGTGRLKLCKKPFATTTSQRTTCLTGLYFNLVTVALKLCAQEVIPLPKHPQATYLYDSTYLLTSADDSFLIQNFTGAGDVIKLRGCRSCLIKPTCDGRIQLPSGGLILRPDPETCLPLYEPLVEILPAPQLKPIFEALTAIADELPVALIGSVQSDLLRHVRLGLARLGDEDITDASIRHLVSPFIDALKMQHGLGFEWAFRYVMLPIGLTMAIGLTIWLLRRYAALRLHRLMCWPCAHLCFAKSTGGITDTNADATAETNDAVPKEATTDNGGRSDERAIGQVGQRRNLTAGR